MIHSGKLIVLAYPDTFVKVSDEWQCKFFPLVGLGTWKQVKAGHAAMVLIENKTGNANYYDFGRYVTPDGFGRVRSAKTDAELEIPFKAKMIGNGPLENSEEFLIWLATNPKKTHGKGRLVASICEEVDFNEAQNYILDLQEKGSVPYKAFKKEGSNCARFVTETILASVKNKTIIKNLQHNKRFSPSTIGNVEIAANSGIFEVKNGVVEKYKGSALKENLTNYFQREKRKSRFKDCIQKLPKDVQKLSGIGSNAWFKIEVIDEFENVFKIKRYNDFHELDYVGLFEANHEFNPLSEFKITYDSHCNYCHVIQNGNKIKLIKIKTCSDFIQLQKTFSA